MFCWLEQWSRPHSNFALSRLLRMCFLYLCLGDLSYRLTTSEAPASVLFAWRTSDVGRKCKFLSSTTPTLKTADSMQMARDLLPPPMPLGHYLRIAELDPKISTSGHCYQLRDDHLSKDPDSRCQILRQKNSKWDQWPIPSNSDI